MSALEREDRQCVPDADGSLLDRELQEYLMRLKAWQVENLMAPDGMEKFAQDPVKNTRG